MLDRRLQELENAARAGDADTILDHAGELARAGRTGAAVQALTRLEAQGAPAAQAAARRLRREALDTARESRGPLGLRRLHDLGEPITALGFTPDGRGLAVGTARGVVARLDEGGALQASSQAMTQGVSALNFALDGSALGAGQGTAKPMVLDPRSLHPRRSFTRARGWVTAVVPGSDGTVVVGAGEWFRHWYFAADHGSRAQPLPDLSGLVPPWAPWRPGDVREHATRLQDRLNLAFLLLDGHPQGPRRPDLLRMSDEMLVADPFGETVAVFHRGRLRLLDLAADEPGPELRLEPDLPRHGLEDQGGAAAALAPGGAALCLGSLSFQRGTPTWGVLPRYAPGAQCILLGAEGPRVLHLLEDEAVTAVAAAPDGDGFALGTEAGLVYRLGEVRPGGVALARPATPPPPAGTPDLSETPTTPVPRPSAFRRLARVYLDLELPTRVALDERYLWVEHLRFEDDWAPGSFLLYDLARLDAGPAARVSSPPGAAPRVLEDHLGVGDDLSPPPPVATWAMHARVQLCQENLLGEYPLWWSCADGRRALGAPHLRAPRLVLVDQGAPEGSHALQVGRAVSHAAFSPRGTRLALLTSAARVELWGAPP